MPYLTIVFIVVVIIALLVIIARNSLVKAENAVEEAFSTMDVYLKKRWDLIPNLARVVKRYAAHEAEVLEMIVNSRKTYSALTTEHKVNANNELDGGLSGLTIVVENYPELKANESFLNLSKELSDMEDEIANARKYYNAVVKIYNNKVEMFPGNIVAGMFGFKVKPMFEATVSEREKVSVSL